MYYLGIDTETGGLKARYHSLLTVGIVVVDRALRIRKKYELKVKANKNRCIKAALKLNKIDVVEHNKHAMSKKDAVKFIQYLCDEYGYKGRVKLIGHNVPFDRGFLNALFKSQRRKFNSSYAYIDTQQIWRGLIAMNKVSIVSSHLDDILDYLKIGRKGRHSALIDIVNTLKVLRAIKKNTIYLFPR